MPSSFTNENRRLIEHVAEAFGDLVDQVVFLGGVTTSLLVDEAAKGAVRKTDDVDVIADLVTRAEYYAFAEKLKAKGFREDQSKDAPICRWVVENDGVEYIVDVMPCEESILGFTNRWYKRALESTNDVLLDNGIKISVVSPLFFLATKFEAFHGRSEGDYYSRDIEDIVFIIEHRTNLVIDFLNGPGDVRSFLSRQASMLLADSNFVDLLPGLVDDQGSSRQVLRQLSLMEKNGH